MMTGFWLFAENALVSMETRVSVLAAMLRFMSSMPGVCMIDISFPHAASFATICGDTCPLILGCLRSHT